MLRWGATSEYRLKIGDFAQTGASWPKILGRKGRPHQPVFSENGAKWSFVWYKNLDQSFFHFVTNYAFDRQTDRQNLISRPRLHSICSAVKTVCSLSLSLRAFSTGRLQVAQQPSMWRGCWRHCTTCLCVAYITASWVDAEESLRSKWRPQPMKIIESQSSGGESYNYAPLAC